jgi:hypothetical protein
MAAVNEPLAVFTDGDGKQIKVYNHIDVKEWEADGYKRVEVKKKRARNPKVEQTKASTEQQKKTISETLKSLISPDDEL